MDIIRGVCLGAVLLSSLLAPGAGQAQNAPYAGKSITLIVSSAPGGGFDAISRLTGRYLQTHIPGNPSVVVQNMPGAGGIQAANHLYNAAPRDGMTIANLQNLVPFEPLFGTQEARFDPLKFNWLGTPSKETALLLVWHTSKIEKLSDAVNNEIILGASGATSTPAFYARILADIFHLKVKLITAYPGQNDQFLAMERGENDGSSSTFWSSLQATRPDWIKNKQVRLLLQYGFEKNRDLPDVPFAADLLRDKPDDSKVMEIAAGPLSLGRPFVAPQDIPADRLAALRKGFEDTFADKAYLAECAKAGLGCDSPLTGDEIQKILADAYGASPLIIDRLRAIRAMR